jgi:GntR family transcriptional regulator
MGGLPHRLERKLAVEPGRLGIRPPTSEEAEFLRMSPDQRVLDVVHTGWTAEGRAVEVCLHVMPAHQWNLEYEWPADPVTD